MNWRRKKNWTPQTTLIQEGHALNDLIGKIHFSLNLRNRQSKLTYLSTMIFCQTENGHWDEHRVFSETHTQRWQSCVHPKHTKAIHLTEDLIVELGLVHKNGIITVLPFSKYIRPLFAKRKLNGKLGLIVDLRKINSLIADHYAINNHSAQHLAGKSHFCKLDRSQA